VRVHIVEPGGHRTAFAANVVWGEGTSAAFAGATAAFRARFARLSSGTGTPPDAVVRTIVDLAIHPRAALRIPVGRDAKTLAALRALLPDGVSMPLLRLGFQRFFFGAPEQRSDSTLSRGAT
jgi:hypothetical protein